MKDASYPCAKEAADAIEAARAALTKHYGATGFTFLVAITNGKLAACANRPLAGGNIKAVAAPSNDGGEPRPGGSA